MWEDGRNKQGGRWLLNVNKQQRMTDLNNYWLEIVSISICEFFEVFRIIAKIEYAQTGTRANYLAFTLQDLMLLIQGARRALR